MHVLYKKTITVLLFLLFFVVAIIFLLNKYNSDRQKAVNIINLNNKNLVFEDDLQYFYEPRADSIESPYIDTLDIKPVYKFNRDTLRESNNYDVVKKDGVYRIIALGDSYTFGLYVPVTKIYPEILEDILNTRLSCPQFSAFEIINLGMSGYDVEYSAFRYRKRGQKYNPDMILWLLNSWNFDKSNEVFHRISASVSEKSGKNTDKEFLAQMAQQEIDNQYTKDFFIDYQKEKMANLLTSFDGDTILAGLVGKEEVKDAVKDFLIPEKIRYFHDLPDIASKQNENLVFPEGHFNSAGHLRTAQVLFEFLVKNFFPRCQLRDGP